MHPAKGHHVTAQAASVEAKVKGNPKCATCSEHLRISSRSYNPDKSIKQTYWHCNNGCFITGHEAPNAKDKLPEDFEQVPPIVEKYVRRSGVYIHPQNLGDVIQTISTLLCQRAIRLTDLLDKARLRGIITNEVKGYQSEYAPKNGGSSQSLDAPVRDDIEGSAARKEFEPAPEAESDPHQQLEAKEAVEARLRDQPAASPDEVIASANEDTRETSRNRLDSKQTYFDHLGAATSNAEEELLAKEVGAGEE